MNTRDSERYGFGPFQLDVNEGKLRRGDAVVPLTGKAFDLLVALVRGAGQTITKTELMAALWPDTTVEESNLTQTVFVLRKALGEDPEGSTRKAVGENGDASDYILTVPRRGYKFVSNVSRQGPGGNDLSYTSAPGSRGRWLWPTIAGVAGLAALGFGLLWMRQPRRLDFSTYHYRPFAYTLGHASHGVWSPDGKSIAFRQGRRPTRLMVQPAEGGVAIQVAEKVSDCSDLAWSPDGARVYFTGLGPVYGIYAVSRAGGQPELVLKQDPPCFGFGLSPDGKALAVWRAPRAADGSVRGSVWISSPPGAEPREYVPAPFSVSGSFNPVCLRFSPNGKWLFLSIYTFSGNAVETWLLPFPAGAGKPRRILRNVPWNRPPLASWLPDSRHLVLDANVLPLSLGVSALWLADIRDESLTKLTDGSGAREEPDVSPDGRRLLFTRVEEDADIVELPVDGSAPRKLLATNTSEYSAAWSPKGGEFAYVTTRNGSDELWLRSSQGDWERPVVTTREFPALVFLHTPAISPDGSRVAYGALLRDPNQPIGSLYVSPASGGTPAWMANGTAPSWSPDGKFLAFLWRKPNSATVLATLQVGADPSPFEIPNVFCTVPPVWSPSGEWIACGTPAGPVLVSPDGHVKRTLPRLDAPVLAWSKDSKTLYGLHQENGNWSLRAEDIGSGAIRKVAEYGSEINPYSPYGLGLRLSPSPDGQSFAIGTMKSQWDLWALEGFPK